VRVDRGKRTAKQRPPDTDRRQAAARLKI